MRIESVFVENFQGLISAQLDLAAPITLVGGFNGAGKSSLKEAIGLALGESARIALKKDYAKLITEGQKKAQIIVSHDGAASSFTLPSGKGERASTAGEEYLPFVLNPSAFAALDDKGRRKMLFALTKSSASPNVIVSMLLDKGADADKVEQIKPLLLSGFSTAMDQAKTNTSESRGAWKAITGEAYGSDKAEGWAVTIPDGHAVDPAELDQASADLNKTMADIENGTQHLGKLNAMRETAEGFALRKAELEEKASMLSRARTKHDVTQKDHDKWTAKLDAAKAAADALKGGEDPCECPSCHTKLRIVGNGLELFAGKQADHAKVSEAAAEVAKANDALALLNRTLLNDKAAIAAAEQAARDLESLNATVLEPVTDDHITKTTDAITLLRTKRDQLSAKINALRERMDLLASADATTAKAAKHHADVKAWSLIAGALAPDGIPGEILAGALEPFNDALRKASNLAGWPAVQISSDIDITANGRAYALLSESEKWRCDTVVALVIAQLSGLRMVVLDRFDVLDIPSRGKLLGMLVTMAKAGQIDSAIVCGTLKEKPAGLPPEVNAVWIDKGIAGTNPMQKAS